VKHKENEMLECIKRFCESCSGEEIPAECLDEECPVFNARSGTITGRRGETWLKKAIRGRCLECCGYEARSVSLCESRECAIWEWRLGDGEKSSKPKTLQEKLFEGDEEDEIYDVLFGS